MRHHHSDAVKNDPKQGTTTALKHGGDNYLPNSDILILLDIISGGGGIIQHYITFSKVTITDRKSRQRSTRSRPTISPTLPLSNGSLVRSVAILSVDVLLSDGEKCSWRTAFDDIKTSHCDSATATKPWPGYDEQPANIRESTRPSGSAVGLHRS